MATTFATVEEHIAALRATLPIVDQGSPATGDFDRSKTSEDAKVGDLVMFHSRGKVRYGVVLKVGPKRLGVGYLTASGLREARKFYDSTVTNPHYPNREAFDAEQQVTRRWAEFDAWAAVDMTQVKTMDDVHAVCEKVRGYSSRSKPASWTAAENLAFRIESMTKSYDYAVKRLADECRAEEEKAAHDKAHADATVRHLIAVAFPATPWVYRAPITTLSLPRADVRLV